MSKKIFVLGVWDLIHKGHRSFLKKAFKLGELTVGIVEDYAVAKEKGLGRPIICESQR